jgi:predicted transcriptional regulator
MGRVTAPFLMTGKDFKEMREWLGYTQNEFASRLHTTQSQITRTETSDKLTWSVQTIVRMLRKMSKRQALELLNLSDAQIRF